jgi:hypothetical protein
MTLFQSFFLSFLRSTLTELSPLAFLRRALRPNPSLKLTRYGMQRKAGVRCLRHCRTPALHCMPPRAA